MIDEPIMMWDKASGEKYYYHYDGLGSVIALSDSDGDVVETYEYDVFGEPNRTSDVGNPYLFTGRRYDDETDLYYYRYRYYSAETGRFLQTDPLGYYYSMNLYEYCLNEPINWIDPWGLKTYRGRRGWRVLPGWGPRPVWDPFAHEYIVTTWPNGRLRATYSFTGDDKASAEWERNYWYDAQAARQALNWGLLELVGDDSLDDYIDDAFKDLEGDYPPWKFPGNTCQDAARELVDLAKELRDKDKKCQ